MMKSQSRGSDLRMQAGRLLTLAPSPGNLTGPSLQTRVREKEEDRLLCVNIFLFLLPTRWVVPVAQCLQCSFLCQPQEKRVHSKGSVHGGEVGQQEPDKAHHVTPLEAELGWRAKRNRVRREKETLGLTLFFIQSRTPACGMVPPTFRVGLPSLVKSFWKHFIDTPCVLGDSKTTQVEDED